MIKSMTGFGKAQATTPAGTITVEIRSLNHRYFDLVARLPNHLAVFEDKLREYVKRKVRRGRINLSASWAGKEKLPGGFSLDLQLARRYYRELLRLKRSLNLQEDLGIAQIVALPEVIAFGQKRERPGRFWPSLRKATDMALAKLNRMREVEGRRLFRDLMRRIKQVRFCLQCIERELPKVIVRYRENLLKKVRALSGTKAVDQERIAQELALFVRNIDVSEELTRIKSHLKGFRQALHSEKEAGKELDFIAQEMFREANTIGAKASDFKISRWVIKIKTQVEKMREQVQNVE